MGVLSYIPIIGKLIDGTRDIISQAVTDKDKRNEILGNLDQLKQEIYLAELGTKTIPWVDGLHKMGRQIINLVTIAAIVTMRLLDVEITQEMVILMGGGNLAYQIIKGKGK